MMRLEDSRVWRRINTRRCIVGLVRRIRFKLIIWAIRTYHPEGISYDPDYRKYIFQWTKELDDDLCRK